MSRNPVRLVGLLVAAVAATVSAMQTGPQFTTAIGWYGQGTWLRTDFHIHSQFSADGVRSIETIVTEAAKHGCDVVGITDHGDRRGKTGTSEFLTAIRAARAIHPDITIIAGMEWNLSPGKGTEHATILFPTGSENTDAFGPFKNRFDDRPGNVPPAEPAAAGLAWLIPTERQALAPVVLINHPSRFPDTPSAPKLTLESLRRAAPSILIGIEGSPGHQRASSPGLYPAGVMDGRWDPLVAQIGGAWDQWLRGGSNVWAAIANSDFHDDNTNDFWPCEFGSTWVYAPDRSPDGVIRALRAGSFFAEHGRIVSNVVLQASLPGLPRPAQVGETVSARIGSKATVSLDFAASARDFLGRASRIDAVEIIAISTDKSEMLYSGPPSSRSSSAELAVPPGGLVVRARGRRDIVGEAALMFYTNPIRITAADR